MCTSRGSKCTTCASHFHFPSLHFDLKLSFPISGLVSSEDQGSHFCSGVVNFWWLCIPPTRPTRAYSSLSPGVSSLVATRPALPFPPGAWVRLRTLPLGVSPTSLPPCESSLWARLPDSAELAGAPSSLPFLHGRAPGHLWVFPLRSVSPSWVGLRSWNLYWLLKSLRSPQKSWEARIKSQF